MWRVGARFLLRYPAQALDKIVCLFLRIALVTARRIMLNQHVQVAELPHNGRRDLCDGVGDADAVVRVASIWCDQFTGDGDPSPSNVIQTQAAYAIGTIRATITKLRYIRNLSHATPSSNSDWQCRLKRSYERRRCKRHL